MPLGTSVREIGMVHAIERAPLPRHVRSEYNSTKAILLIRAGKGLFSRRRGSIRAFCVYLDQATSMCQLSRAPRTFFALDQTTDNLHCAWNVRRSDERKVRTACGKRPVTTPTDHPTSTMKTTRLPEERSVSPGASRQDGSNLETGPHYRPARDASARAA